MSNSTAPADGAPPQDAANSKLWIVGVLISIVATVGSNGGINLQKVSIMKELAKPRSQQRAYVLQPLWLLGFIGVVVGALGDFGSLAFAPQSLLIPLGGLTLLFNIWFARLCLGERTSRRDLIATMFLLVGVVMITVTGSKTGHNYTISELKALFGEPPFIGYIIVVGACMGALYWYQRYCANLRRQFGPWSKQYTRVHKSHVFSLPLLAGLFAAQTIWAAKAVVEMVKTTALGDNQFVYFGFYALLATTVTLVLSQLHFLSRSLEHAPALIAVPIFQSVLIVGSIIGGGVLYKELSGLSGIEIGIFMVGLFVMLFGMWLLSKRKLEGPVPPTKLFLYATIARFIVRTRTTLRQQEAEKWPNRLHLYACTCDCHLLVLHGERAALRLSSRLSGVGKGSGSLEAALASLGGAGTAPGGGASSSAALAGAGHRVLETIQDAGEEEEEDCEDEDNDALDYALAKRERERVTRASGTYEPPSSASSASSASWSRGSPGTAAGAAAAAPDSLRSAPGPRALSARHLAALADAGNGGISSVMVGGPVQAVGAASAVLKDNASPTTATVPNPMISAAPGGGPGSQRHGSHPGHHGAAVSDVDMRFYCEGHASLGRQHSHAPQASAGAFPAGGGNDGYVNADGSPALGAAEDPSLPPMCPRCCCRVTPVSVLSARKAFLMSKPAAEALVAALNHIGTGSAGLDSGAKGPGSFASGAAPGAGAGGAGAGLRTSSGDSLASSTRHLMPGSLSASSIGRGEDWDRTLAAVTAEESSRGRQSMRGGAGLPPLSAAPAGAPAASVAGGSAASLASSARPGIEVPGGGSGSGGLASLTGGPLSVGGAGALGGPLSVGSTAALMPDGRESVRSVRVAVAAAGGAGADAAAGGAPRPPMLSQERRGSRAVTKEQVAAVMSSMQQRSRSSIAGLPMPAVLPLPSLSFYDASNPAVPSFMAVPTPAPASHAAALQQVGGAPAGEGGLGGARVSLVLSGHGGGAAAARSPPLGSSGGKPRSATFSGLEALGSGGAAGSGGQGSAGSAGGDRRGSFALGSGPAPGPGHHVYRTSSAEGEGGGKASGARGVELAVAASGARPGRARAGTAGAGGGGVVWHSTSRHYQYDGDVEGDDDDDDDPVVQAISALGESVMDLGRRTRSSIAHGIQSIGRLGRRRPEGAAAAAGGAAAGGGGGDSTPSHRSSPAASADATGRGLELVPGAASQTGGAIPLPSVSPRGPAGAAGSGRASPAAFTADAGAAGATGAGRGGRVRVLKPVADAVSAVVGGARDAARDIRELREGSGGAFERMRDDEEEGAAGGGRRPGPEGRRGSGEGGGETDGSWAQGGEDSGAESEGGPDADPAVGIGAAAGAAAQPVPHGSDATRRARRPTGARRAEGAAGEGGSAEGAVSGSESDGRGGQRYRAGDGGSAAGTGAPDAAAGQPQPVPGAVTYPAAARRYSRRGRRSTAMYSRTSVPLPNSLVVSAGIEGLTTVTVAAIRKLFAPGGEGSTIAGSVLSTAPPGSGLAAASAAGSAGAGVGPEYPPRGAGAASAPPGSIAVSVGSPSTARMGGGAASAGAGGASSPPFAVLSAPSATAAADGGGSSGAARAPPAATAAAGEPPFEDTGAGGV